MKRANKKDTTTAIEQYNKWRDSVQPVITGLETRGAYSALIREVQEIGRRIYAGQLWPTTQALVDHVHIQIRRCKEGYYSHVEGNSWFLA